MLYIKTTESEAPLYKPIFNQSLPIIKCQPRFNAQTYLHRQRLTASNLTPAILPDSQQLSRNPTINSINFIYNFARINQSTQGTLNRRNSKTRTAKEATLTVTTKLAELLQLNPCSRKPPSPGGRIDLEQNDKSNIQQRR